MLRYAFSDDAALSAASTRSYEQQKRVYVKALMSYKENLAALATARQTLANLRATQPELFGGENPHRAENDVANKSREAKA